MINVIKYPKRIHDAIAMVTMKMESMMPKMTSLITPDFEATPKVNWRIKTMDIDKMTETSILAIRKKTFVARRRSRISISRRRRNRTTTAAILFTTFMVSSWNYLYILQAMKKRLK